jgi:hypothetical protein
MSPSQGLRIWLMLGLWQKIIASCFPVSVVSKLLTKFFFLYLSCFRMIGVWDWRRGQLLSMLKGNETNRTVIFIGWPLVGGNLFGL